MSSYNKFQLPPIKGTEVFPETIKSPPVVHASVEYLVDDENPVAPEVLEDRAKNLLTANGGTLGHFVQSQRQNYGSGITDFVKTTRSYPDFDVAYMNIQGRHEIITIHLRVDVRRHRLEEEEKEEDEMMLLVLHDGNRISAVPMARFAEQIFSPTYTHVCEQSFWGNNPVRVNQLRLGSDYSVIASELWLGKSRIEFVFGAVMIATDDFDKSLEAYNFTFEIAVMNGSNGTIYLPFKQMTYDGTTLSSTRGEGGDAVSASGEWMTNTRDTLYTLNITPKNAAVSVREVPIGVTTDAYYNTSESRVWRAITEGTGVTSGCGSYYTVTMDPIDRSLSGRVEYPSSGYFDDINLGNITAVPKTATQVLDRLYVGTYKGTYGNNFMIHVQHKQPPKGDGGSYTIPAGAGTITFQYVTTTPGNKTVTPPPSPFCSTVVGELDLCAGGWFNSTDASIDGCAQDLAGKLGCTYCALISSEYSTGAAYESYVKSTTHTLEGAISDAELIPFPYAVNDKLYYMILNGPSKTITTAYRQSGSDSFTGFLNVSNGQYLIQGFDLDGQRYIMLDSVDIGANLAAALETSVSSINAIYMDIPRSKIEQFQ